MIKGCQKKIIQIKDTGSKYFEEAYFVIKEETLKSEINECNIVKDATEIVNEYVGGINRQNNNKQRCKSFVLFLIGFLIGSMMSIGTILIFF
jgi:hypothetical protein